MAECAKRNSSSVEINDEVDNKRFKSGANGETVSDFMHWCTKEGMKINEKVTVNVGDCCADYGMLATANIDQDEVLFEVPRSMLLTPQTTAIAEVLSNEMDSIKSESGWVPLMLALLHEYSVGSSRWRPYFHCFFNKQRLDLPMFWSMDQLNSELHGTTVIEAVNKDLVSIQQEFKTTVLPFCIKHQDLFTEECRDIELYKKMVAFVMAYSFTEPNEEDEEDDATEEKNVPMMVPMADALNHTASNNAHLKFDKNSLKMVACRPIQKGEEVYNTYGELANSQLLHMYGFAEKSPKNSFETVDIGAAVVFQAVTKEHSGEEVKNLKHRLNNLSSQGVISDERPLVLGVDGVLTEEEALLLLKVLKMTNEQFETYMQNDGWIEDEGEIESLLFDDLHKLSAKDKVILKRIGEEQLKEYTTSLEKEESVQKNESLSSRQRYAAHVRYGQLKLLHRLIDSCAA